MKATIREVLGQLQVEGLVQAPDEGEVVAVLEGRTARPTEPPQPWFVRILMGLGAWVASLCFLGFLALIHIVDSQPSALVVGALLAGTATALRYASRHDATVQLSLSLCLAGRALVYGGLTDANSIVVATAALVLEGAMVLIYPDPVNRFISTNGMWVAFLVILDQLHAPPWLFGLATAGLGALVAVAWERQGALVGGRWAQHHAPVAAALPVSLLVSLIVLAATDHADALPGAWTASAGLTVVFLVFLARTLRQHAVPRPWLWLLIAGLFGALTSSTPALLASLLVLGLGFHRRQPLLIGLAAAALVTSGVLFYYHLSLTLLVKAGVLVASGALLLGARAWLEIERRRAS